MSSGSDEYWKRRKQNERALGASKSLGAPYGQSPSKPVDYKELAEEIQPKPELSEAEAKFLKENFKAGEYCTVTLMVKLDELEKFTELLKTSGLNMVMLQKAQAKLDFAKPDTTGIKQ